MAHATGAYGGTRSTKRDNLNHVSQGLGGCFPICVTFDQALKTRSANGQILA